MKFGVESGNPTEEEEKIKERALMLAKSTIKEVFKITNFKILSIVLNREKQEWEVSYQDIDTRICRILKMKILD